MPFFSEKPPVNRKKQAEFFTQAFGRKEQMPELTAAEVQRMRELVAAHDKSAKKERITDLSKPPVEPYRYRPFPKVLYNHAESTPTRHEKVAKHGGVVEDVTHHVHYATITVHDQEELEAALADGYSEKPPVWDEEGQLVAEVNMDGGVGQDIPKRRWGRKKQAEEISE